MHPPNRGKTGPQRSWTRAEIKRTAQNHYLTEREYRLERRKPGAKRIRKRWYRGPFVDDRIGRSTTNLMGTGAGAKSANHTFWEKIANSLLQVEMSGLYVF